MHAGEIIDVGPIGDPGAHTAADGGLPGLHAKIVLVAASHLGNAVAEQTQRIDELRCQRGKIDHQLLVNEAVGTLAVPGKGHTAHLLL